MKDSLENSLSTLINIPKLKYLDGNHKPKQNIKTGSGIRAVNMSHNKNKQETKNSTSESISSNFSFTDTIKYILDISYFLSIMTSIASPLFTRLLLFFILNIFFFFLDLFFLFINLVEIN